MVKVAENSVVDLDILPGNKGGDKLVQQARYASRLTSTLSNAMSDLTTS